jgi:hypothetical protein
VGFFPVDPLIGLAEWANLLLNIPHKFKDDPLLVVPGMKADRAKFAYFRERPIQ